MSAMDSSRLLAQLNDIPAEELVKDEKARKNALNLARGLVAALEDPVNRATELVFTVSIFSYPLNDGRQLTFAAIGRSGSSHGC